MDFIDNSFTKIGEWARENIPRGILNNLITDTELKTNAVTTDKVQDGAITFYKMKATITSDTTAPTGGTSGDMHFIVAS